MKSKAPYDNASTFYTSTSKLKITREIKIPVPWGFVAGKVYGDSSNPPVLCLHGWLDNCNSFDPLIPLLPTDFEWNVFSLMSHSMGAHYSGVYAGTFPEKVDKLILLDSLGVYLMEKNHDQIYLRKTVGSYLKLESKIKHSVSEHSHSYQNAKAKLLKANIGLNDKMADIILERGTKQLEDGTYVYLRDIRHMPKEPSALQEQASLKFFCNIKAETIHLLSDMFFPVYIRESNKSFVSEAFSHFKNCEFHERILVGGNHYVHMNSPERVIGHIKRILSRPPRPGLMKPVSSRL